MRSEIIYISSNNIDYCGIDILNLQLDLHQVLTYSEFYSRNRKIDIVVFATVLSYKNHI